MWACQIKSSSYLYERKSQQLLCISIAMHIAHLGLDASLLLGLLGSVCLIKYDATLCSLK